MDSEENFAFLQSPVNNGGIDVSNSGSPQSIISIHSHPGSSPLKHKLYSNPKNENVGLVGSIKKTRFIPNNISLFDEIINNGNVINGQNVHNPIENVSRPNITPFYHLPQYIGGNDTINNDYTELSTENRQQIVTNLEPVDCTNHIGTRLPVDLLNYSVTTNGYSPSKCLENISFDNIFSNRACNTSADSIKNRVVSPFPLGANCTLTSKNAASFFRVGVDSPTNFESDEFTHIDFIDLSNSDASLDVGTSINSLHSDGSHLDCKNSIVDYSKNDPSSWNNSTLQPSLTVIEKPPYFANLMEIFPNDDENILLDLCAGNESLNVAIEKVLRYKEKVNHLLPELPVKKLKQSRETNLAEPNETELYNKQLSALKEILVDADPTYLENTFKNELQGDQEKIDAFVIDVLRKKNIPTVKQYQDRLKEEEQFALYTQNFSVEAFLKEIPDPLNYFTEANNGSCYKDVSLIYLKRRYSKISVKCIRETMDKNKNNLTVTDLELSKMPPNLSARRFSPLFIVNQNLAAMKEICFIEHQEEIIKYLKNKDDQKQDAFIKAKECGELFECNCCFNDEVIIEEIVTCPEAHIFCKTCVRKGVETKLGEGVQQFSCLTDCDSEFSLQTLENVLSSQLFSKIMLQKQSEEIKAANIPEIEDCPFCEYMGIPIAESTVFTCLNPDCAKESCRKCHGESHIPLRCNEVEQKEEVKLRTYIEDKMTEALIRKCYKCQKEYIKESGCNKITCSCGALQCYICRKPVKDYSHFNPQKGLEIHKCPLYSTDKVLHIDAVNAAATAVKKSLLPNTVLKHDPTKFLPQ